MASVDVLKAEVSRLISKEKPLVCPHDGNPCHRSLVNCIDYYYYSGKVEEFFCPRFKGLLPDMVASRVVNHV